MLCHNATISHWGPYEIDACRYNLAQEQVRHLESGAARYRAVDSFNLNDDVINCVHAITHASPASSKPHSAGDSRRRAGYESPGQAVCQGRRFPGYPETHDWILAAIGADKYATTKRQPGEFIPRRNGDPLPGKVLSNNTNQKPPPRAARPRAAAEESFRPVFDDSRHAGDPAIADLAVAGDEDTSAAGTWRSPCGSARTSRCRG